MFSRGMHFTAPGAALALLLMVLLTALFSAPAAWAQNAEENSSIKEAQLPEEAPSTERAQSEHALHPSHDLHVGVHVGWWNFDDAFRYEDDALFGLRLGAWVSRGFSIEVDLEHMRTRNERVGEWVRVIFMNLHGRLHYKPEAPVSPGFLMGVSFMAADNEQTENSITEGFDLGPVLTVRLGERTSLIAEAIFRYTSVRANFETPDGELLNTDEVQYVWSRGFRLGVDFAF